MIAAVRRLVDRGLSVLPVPRPRAGSPPGRPGDGKIPAISWKAFQSRLPRRDEIERWFAVPMNIAVVTGAISGVVVIDADTFEAVRWATKHLPYTPWQTQTARGFHLWYRHPGVPIPNRARVETRDGRLAIDVRGDGGFVIAPGSIHASGFVYAEAGDWSVPKEALPRFWSGWLKRRKRAIVTPGRTVVRRGDHLFDRARHYLATIPKPEIGNGSDNATFCAACFLVRGFGLSASDAEAVLWEWAGSRPGWTPEWVARKVAHAEKYGDEPVGRLR
jgi:hypothetical protein